MVLVFNWWWIWYWSIGVCNELFMLFQCTVLYAIRCMAVVQLRSCNGLRMFRPISCWMSSASRSYEASMVWMLTLGLCVRARYRLLFGRLRDLDLYQNIVTRKLYSARVYSMRNGIDCTRSQCRCTIQFLYSNCSVVVGRCSVFSY